MAQKKTFKDNLSPAMQFITTSEGENPFANVEPKPGMGFPPIPLQPVQPAPQGKPPAGYKNNPLYIETKSKRLQLLIQPSLLERIKEQATASGKSVNEFVHSILENATKGEE